MKQILPEQLNQNDAEEIASYLRGELNTDERASVEDRRKSDTTFNELFEAHIKLAAATRLSNLESKLKMLSEHARPGQVGQESSLPHTKVISLGRRQLFTRLAAAGAILLLVAVGARILIPQEHDRIFQAHFTNSIVPGESELSAITESENAKAHAYYSREKYTKAAKEFDRLALAHPDKDYLLFAAISHLGAGHLQRASLLLDQYKTQFPDRYQSEVVMFQTLIKVRRGDLDEANKILDVNASMIQENKKLKSLDEALEGKI